MKIQKETFSYCRRDLDGNEYLGCTFTHCHLVFAAIAPVSLIGCTITDCTWGLEGPAARTIDFLRALHGNGGTGRELVERVVGQITGKAKARAGKGTRQAASRRAKAPALSH